MPTQREVIESFLNGKNVPQEARFILGALKEAFPDKDPKMFQAAISNLYKSRKLQRFGRGLYGLPGVKYRGYEAESFPSTKVRKVQTSTTSPPENPVIPASVLPQSLAPHVKSREVAKLLLQYKCKEAGGKPVLLTGILQDVIAVCQEMAVEGKIWLQPDGSIVLLEVSSTNGFVKPVSTPARPAARASVPDAVASPVNSEKAPVVTTKSGPVRLDVTEYKLYSYIKTYFTRISFSTLSDHAENGKIAGVTKGMISDLIRRLCAKGVLASADGPGVYVLKSGVEVLVPDDTPAPRIPIRPPEVGKKPLTTEPELLQLLIAYFVDNEGESNFADVLEHIRQVANIPAADLHHRVGKTLNRSVGKDQQLLFLHLAGSSRWQMLNWKAYEEKSEEAEVSGGENTSPKEEDKVSSQKKKVVVKEADKAVRTFLPAYVQRYNVALAFLKELVGENKRKLYRYALMKRLKETPNTAEFKDYDVNNLCKALVNAGLIKKYEEVAGEYDLFAEVIQNAQPLPLPEETRVSSSEVQEEKLTNCSS